MRIMTATQACLQGLQLHIYHKDFLSDISYKSKYLRDFPVEKIKHRVQSFKK